MISTYHDVIFFSFYSDVIDVENESESTQEKIVMNHFGQIMIML
jgi:hypothetical protein